MIETAIIFSWDQKGAAHRQREINISPGGQGKPSFLHQARLTCHDFGEETINVQYIQPIKSGFCDNVAHLCLARTRFTLIKS